MDKPRRQGCPRWNFKKKLLSRNCQLKTRWDRQKRKKNEHPPRQREIATDSRNLCSKKRTDLIRRKITERNKVLMPQGGVHLGWSRKRGKACTSGLQRQSKTPGKRNDRQEKKDFPKAERNDEDRIVVEGRERQVGSQKAGTWLRQRVKRGTAQAEA